MDLPRIWRVLGCPKIKFPVILILRELPGLTKSVTFGGLGSPSRKKGSQSRPRKYPKLFFHKIHDFWQTKSKDVLDGLQVCKNTNVRKTTISFIFVFCQKHENWRMYWTVCKETKSDSLKNTKTKQPKRGKSFTFQRPLFQHFCKKHKTKQFPEQRL